MRYNIKTNIKETIKVLALYLNKEKKDIFCWHRSFLFFLRVLKDRSLKNKLKLNWYFNYIKLMFFLKHENVFGVSTRWNELHRVGTWSQICYFF